MIRIESPFAPLAHLDGARIVALNWRDVEHPQAGGAEQYMHQIARRWVEVGARVTWVTSRAPGQTRRAMIDGVEVVRAGGALSLYPRAALPCCAASAGIDYVVDCQDGIPFFSPLFVEKDVPIVQVIHHVHLVTSRTAARARSSPCLSVRSPVPAPTATPSCSPTRPAATIPAKWPWRYLVRRNDKPGS